MGKTKLNVDNTVGTQGPVANFYENNLLFTYAAANLMKKLIMKNVSCRYSVNISYKLIIAGKKENC